MDLESPLRTIASPVEAEVLRVLAGADADFSSSQVHRLIGSASPYGVRKALARLADSGLVLSLTQGNWTLWRGNRHHVLWPSIELAVDARRALVSRLRDQFAERNELLVYLYGSFARRSATPESDIDILIVYPDDVEHDALVDFAHNLSQQVLAWTGNEGHVNSVTRSWLSAAIDGGDSVVMSIRQDAVALIGPEFEQLIRVLRAEGSARV